MKYRLLLGAVLAAVIASGFSAPATAADRGPQITLVTVTREIVDTHSMRWRYVIHIHGYGFSRVTEISIDGRSADMEGEGVWKIERETIGMFGTVAIHVTLPPVDFTEAIKSGLAGRQSVQHNITVTNVAYGPDGERDPAGSTSASATAEW